MTNKLFFNVLSIEPLQFSLLNLAMKAICTNARVGFGPGSAAIPKTSQKGTDPRCVNSLTD